MTEPAADADLVVATRRALGIGGDTASGSFRSIAREHGVGLYPLLAMIALSASQELGGGSEGILAPEIAQTLGLGPTFFVLLGMLTSVVGFVIPLIVSFLVRDRPVRAVVTLASAGLWSVIVTLSGFAPTAFFWALYSVLDTGTSAANATVSGSLTMDVYPPKVRVRAMAYLSSASTIAGLAMPALLVVLIDVFALTWRGVLFVTGLLSLLLFLFAVRLRDPGLGAYDRTEVRKVVRGMLHESDEAAIGAEPQRHHPSFVEVYRSLWAIRTSRLGIIAGGVGALAYPADTALTFYFESALGFTSSDFARMQLFTGGASLLGLWLLAPFGDRIFQQSPRHLYLISAGMAVVGAAALVVNVVFPSRDLVVVLNTVTAFTGSFIGPATAVGTMTVIPPEYRHYTGSVWAASSTIGGLVGGALFVTVGQTSGIGPAIILVVLTSLVGALLTGIAGDAILDDVDAGIARVVEDERARARLSAGVPEPFLSCTDIHFSYGPVEVLHGVDLEVQEGEILGLLGLNGSGKSTLLRLIAGTATPTAGSIRFASRDITYVGVNERFDRGIVLMLGGHARFKSLTVLEHLRLANATSHRTRRPRSGAFDECFDRFPALAPLADRPAGLLSGGEAQMLGLARALVARPRLVLIDELSLGLAPMIVDDLVGHVRAINANGTSVVVVEQSIDTALRLADRSIFLDRGVVRFDGPTEALRARSDLVRAVFLGSGQ